MVPMTTINAAAVQKQAARQKIIKQLQGAGATSTQMPGSLEVETDEAQEALADLLAKGEVREARAGLFYLDEAKVKEAQSGNGFVALLVILIVVSVTASVIALAASSA